MSDAIEVAVGLIIGGNFGYGYGWSRGRRKARVIVAAKTVDNRTMPDYTRAERRAHKRRSRG